MIICKAVILLVKVSIIIPFTPWGKVWASGNVLVIINHKHNLFITGDVFPNLCDNMGGSCSIWIHIYMNMR